jgi:hypothetical protein
MKVTATIEVEFEMDQGQPENAANAALARGRGELQIAIEHGVQGIRTGVKRGSARATITRQQIIP